jgi:hypothetical protein
MQCTVCQRQANDRNRRCACGGLMVEDGQVNHQRNLEARAKIQPLRVMLAGCTSPEIRQKLRSQINELSRAAVQ